MAMVATMRGVGRLPVRTIQWQLGTFHRLALSTGEIVRILRVGRDRAEVMRQGLLGELRGSPVVHGDETSWREGGQNGYLWSFSSPEVRYFEYRRSRSGEIVTEVLGDDVGGVLVSDFYGGYNSVLGRHQRCGVHVLTDDQYMRETWHQD